MKLSIKKLIKNDFVLEWCWIFILLSLIFLVLNLGFGINITKRKIYHERNYFVAYFEAAIILLCLVVAIIRIFWLKKKISGGKQVYASVTGLREEKATWKKGASYFLGLSFDIDENHFEKDRPVNASSDIAKMVEKGSTRILVKDSEAEDIVLLELFCDMDF